MKKAILAVALLLCASAASAATIHVTVQTDQTNYTQGGTVKWTINAWTDANTAGISLLGVTLTESKGETMNAALTSGSGPFAGLRSSFTVATDQTIYNAFTPPATFDGFTLQSAGTPGAGGVLADILVQQNPSSLVLNIGNDGVAHIFAIGSFTANVAGSHTLTPTLTGFNYIPLTGGAPLEFESTSLQGAAYDVAPLEVPEPATLGLVGMGLVSAIGFIRRRK